jgi:hypothetical protein
MRRRNIIVARWVLLRREVRQSLDPTSSLFGTLRHDLGQRLMSFLIIWPDLSLWFVRSILGSGSGSY